MDSQFHQSKNHEVLWSRITDMLNSAGVKVTKAQVMNKWKNMKKKYREVLDANNKTGNSPTTWKYLEDFNRIFGHKASSTAVCTFDSSRKGREKLISVPNDSNSTSSEEMDKDGTCKEVEKEQTRKRKTENLSSMFQRLEDIGKSMVEQMDRHQEEKMQRFDRFLDIFSQKI